MPRGCHRHRRWRRSGSSCCFGARLRLIGRSLRRPAAGARHRHHRGVRVRRRRRGPDPGAGVGHRRGRSFPVSTVRASAAIGCGLRWRSSWASGCCAVAGPLVRRYYLAVAEYGTERLWRRQLFASYLDLPLSFFQQPAHRRAPRPRRQRPHGGEHGAQAAGLRRWHRRVGGRSRWSACWLVHPLLALIALVLFPLLAIDEPDLHRTVSRCHRRWCRSAVGDVSSIAHESFDGVLVVKALGREADEVARFAEAADRLRRERIGVGRLRATFEPAIDSLPNLGIVGLLVMGAWLIDQGQHHRRRPGRLDGAVHDPGPARAHRRLLPGGDAPQSVVALERIDRVLDELGARRPRANATACWPTVPSRCDSTASHLDYDDHPVLDEHHLRGPSRRGGCHRRGRPGAASRSLARLLVDLDAGPAGCGVDRWRLGVRPRSSRPVHEAVALAFQETFLFADHHQGERRPRPAARTRRSRRGAGPHRRGPSSSSIEMPEGVRHGGGRAGRHPVGRAATAGGPGPRPGGQPAGAVPRRRHLGGRPGRRGPRSSTTCATSCDSRCWSWLTVCPPSAWPTGSSSSPMVGSRGEGTHDELLAVPAYEALVRAYEEDGA